MPGCLDIAAGTGFVCPGHDYGLEMFEDVMLKEFFEEYLLVRDGVLLQPEIDGIPPNMLLYVRSIQEETAKRVNLVYQSLGSIKGKFITFPNETEIVLDNGSSSIKALVAFEPGSLETVRAIELDCGTDAIPCIHDGEYIENGNKCVALDRLMYLVDFINDKVTTCPITNKPITPISTFADNVRRSINAALSGKTDPHSSLNITSPDILRTIEAYNKECCPITQKVRVLLENFPYPGYAAHLKPLVCGS